MNSSDDRHILITRGELVAILLAVLPVFLFLGGPIWEHPFHIDSAVYWSYAPVPALVLLVLLRRRALTIAGFLASATIALSVKYLITTGVAFALWSLNDPPPLAESSPPAEMRRVPARTVLSSTGAAEITLDGRAIAPSTLSLHRGQPVIFRSLDGSLHTIRAVRGDGTVVLNRPVIPGRPGIPIPLAAERGGLTLSCGVHPSEAPLALASGG
jgi:hypothetical protein